MAVWVDFDLTPAIIKSENDDINENNGNDENPEDNEGIENTGNNNSKSNEEDFILRQWDEEKQDFPCHLKLNLKFFPLPITVKKNVTVLTT